MKKKNSKVKKVMQEFGEGKLHSGSKKGPVVSNPKQAIAIALSEQRKAGKGMADRMARHIEKKKHRSAMYA